MLLANFDRKEHLQHRAVSLRQHGFLVYIYESIMVNAWYSGILPDPHWFDIWSHSVIHWTATKTLEDHRNMSHVLSKLRDVQQKKLDVIFNDVCVLARIYLACLSQVLNARDRSACCCVSWRTTGQSRLNHELILVTHSARPVDLDGVTEDFVRFNDQRKDDFGLQSSWQQCQTLDSDNYVSGSVKVWMCDTLNVMNLMDSGNVIYFCGAL